MPPPQLELTLPKISGDKNPNCPIFSAGPRRRRAQIRKFTLETVNGTERLNMVTFVIQCTRKQFPFHIDGKLR